jgi:hypothetical protein
MIMDWRRSCSISKMQILQPSEGQVTIDVAWYFAPPGAKTFRGVNAFSSGIWDRDKPELPPLLGEQPPYQFPYSLGENVWGYVGQCKIGTDDNFANGLSLDDLTRTLTPPQNCCRPNQDGAGEVLGCGVLDNPSVLGTGELLGAGVFNSSVLFLGTGEVLGVGSDNPDEYGSGNGILLGCGEQRQWLVGFVIGWSATWYFTPGQDGTGIVHGCGASQLYESPIGTGELHAGGESPNVPDFPGAGELLGAGELHAEYLYTGTGLIAGCGVHDAQIFAPGAGIKLTGGNVSLQFTQVGAGEKLAGGYTYYPLVGVKMGCGVTEEDRGGGAGEVYTPGNYPTPVVGYVIGWSGIYSVH